MAVLPDWGVLLFGGKQADGSLADNDNWRFSFSGHAVGSWGFNFANDNPSPRWGHAMVTDPLRKKILLFGGKSGDTVLAETWEFDPTNSNHPWTKTRAAAIATRALRLAAHVRRGAFASCTDWRLGGLTRQYLRRHLGMGRGR